MSNKNLGIILLSSVLTFSAGPSAFSQTAATQDKIKKSQQNAAVVGSDDVRRFDQAVARLLGPRKMTSQRTMTGDTASSQKMREFDQTVSRLVGSTDITALREKPGDTPSALGTQSGVGVGTVSSVEDVRRWQMALKERGYDPGEINGLMSSDTREALRQFQTAYKLSVSGNFDDETQAALHVAVNSSPDSIHGQFADQSSNKNNPTDTELSAQASQKPAGPPTLRMKPDQNSSEQTSKPGDRTLDSTTLDLSKLDGDKSQTKTETTKAAKIDGDLRDRLAKSSDVVEGMMAASDKRIPEELLQRAEAIAVIPNVVKGAIGIGGRYGKGVVSRRMDNGHWSAPSFVSIGGGSFGAQLGISSTDLVLVFTDKGAAMSLEKGTSVKLGVDADVVAGPIGRSGEAGVTHDLKSGVYAYSRAKGLFAGVALDGAALDIDEGANHKVYGAKADIKSIFNNETMASNANVRKFISTLDRLATRKMSER